MAESKEDIKGLLMRVKEESGKAGLKLNSKLRAWPLDEGERGEWKSWLKTQLKTKIMASGPITSWQIEG